MRVKILPQLLAVFHVNISIFPVVCVSKRQGQKPGKTQQNKNKQTHKQQQQQQQQQKRSPGEKTLSNTLFPDVFFVMCSVMGVCLLSFPDKISEI